MGADQHNDWAAVTRSVIDWWRDAGVDVLVGEAPHDWLARTPPPAPPVEAATVAATLPDTLEAFAAWRVGSDAPEGAGGILAEGDPAAEVMVIGDCPDDDAVIGGEAGRLFERMLAATGLSRDTIYLTALTTRRPLGGRVAPEAMPRLAELLAHHVELVAPKRLLILGQAPSRALIGTDVAPTARNLHAVNLKSATVDAVASLHPRFLIEKPAMKAQAWRDLQLLMRGADSKGDMG